VRIGSPARLLTAAVMLVAAGCGSSSGGPAATASPGARAHLEVSYSELVPDSLALWSAADGSYFTKSNLDVSVQLIDSAKGIPALLSGQTNIAVIGGSNALSAAVSGADLDVVAVLAPVYPYQLMVPASVSGADQLRGKRLGVSAIGSSSDIATRVALRKLGLDPTRDVTIVAVGSSQNRIAAMYSGAIQGSVNQPPDTVAMKARGFHSILDLAAARLPTANTGVVVQRSWASTHKAVVQRFIDALVEASVRVRRDVTFTTNVLKRWEKSSDTAGMRATADYYAREIVPALPYPRSNMFGDALAVLEARNPAAKGYDVKKLIDQSYVKSSDSRGLGT
jgi:NitT/TauT family transport system substrate-binding protein